MGKVRKDGGQSGQGRSTLSAATLAALDRAWAEVSANPHPTPPPVSGQLLTGCGTGGGRGRVQSHRHFVVRFVLLIPDLLRHSVPLFLKRQCDRTPGRGGQARFQGPPRDARRLGGRAREQGGVSRTSVSLLWSLRISFIRSPPQLREARCAGTRQVSVQYLVPARHTK